MEILVPLLSALLGMLGGGLSGAIFGPPLRTRLFDRPELSLRFDPDDRECVVHDFQSQWARIAIKNSGRVHLTNCQTFVTEIKQERNGRWEDTEPKFTEPLVLEWAAMPDEVKHRPQQIPRGMTFFGNFLGATATENKLKLSVYHWPHSTGEIFAEFRRYCFTLTVTADQVEPKTIDVIVNWTGNWKFETSRGPCI
jgi:hypothetical protein